MDNYSVQVSLKIGDTLVNLRGATVAEVLAQLGEFTEHAQWVGEQLAVVQQAGNAVSGAVQPAYIPPVQQAPPAPQYGPPAQPQPQYGPPATQPAPTGQHNPVYQQGSVPPSPGSPSCNHGSMEWKEGVSRAGKAYKGYYCKAPRGQASCSPVYIN